MRILFVGPGYPGVPDADAGSGIGTYLREMTVGLTERGHECHVLIPSPVADAAPFHLGSITIHRLVRRHWPIVERWYPGAREVYDRAATVRRLDRIHQFDWIEIESDEGIDIGVQRALPDKTILRLHTTLAQMVEYKRVPPSRHNTHWLNRERRSLQLARRIITHSAGHAAELERLFPGLPPLAVVEHGLDVPAPRYGRPPAGPARFLVIGTLDLRKGSDRLREVLETYVHDHGPAELRLVSSFGEDIQQHFRLAPPYPRGLQVHCLAGLTDPQLYAEMSEASALLHLARYESFGLPLIEAAATGLPVVATATGIAPELLAGSLAEFLIDGDEPVGCAAALAKAAKGRFLIGRLLRHRYETRFTRDHMVDGYLERLAWWAEWAQALDQPTHALAKTF